MKKIYLLLFFTAVNMYAQIPNRDFETGLGYGGENVASWGQPFSFAVSINPETGETIQDEITFGEQTLGMFCSAVPDPHSGEKAMLIRNGFNITTNTVLPAHVSLFNSEMSDFPSGWNVGIPVAADIDIQFLSFWYKFAPVGNDAAQATLELFNTEGESIGTAKIRILEPASTYTYATAPMVLSGIGGDPAFLRIDFALETEDTAAVFGSTLTIDDLAVNPSQLQTENFAQTGFLVWPTLASSEINILTNGNGLQAQNFKIANIEGKIVAEKQLQINSERSQKIDISALANGFYILSSDDGFTAKFIKK